MTWDYSVQAAKKQAQADKLWRLERFINYGTPKMKLRRAELKQLLPELRISEDRRAFLHLLVWNEKTF